jgi:hypothetical protein
MCAMWLKVVCLIFKNYVFFVADVGFLQKSDYYFSVSRRDCVA